MVSRVQWVSITGCIVAFLVLFEPWLASSLADAVFSVVSALVVSDVVATGDGDGRPADTSSRNSVTSCCTPWLGLVLKVIAFGASEALPLPDPQYVALTESSPAARITSAPDIAPVVNWTPVTFRYSQEWYRRRATAEIGRPY